MFDNKSLQLASYGHLDYHYFQSFLNDFENASLVNLNGDLLFSRDTELCSTTTSRLVSYQIVKKYLKLSPGDIFITNDPENGGYSYSKVFFISSLTENLFLIWSEDANQIQFKIPLSPLVEANKKNNLLWSMMIDPHPQKVILTEFFEQQIKHYVRCYQATPFLEFLSEQEFQRIWFKTCKEEFDRQFDLRAQGQTNLNVKYQDKLIKVNLGIEEKQNQRLINIDFSSTQVAEKLCAASHIIESAMIQEFVYHYKLHQFLSQPILNQIKLIMPPKSVVSKASPMGEYNFELQSVIRQVFKYLLLNLNNSKKVEKFHLKSEAQLNFKFDTNVRTGYLLDENFSIEDISSHLAPKIMTAKENNFTGEFIVKKMGLTLDSCYLYSDFDHSKRFIKINNKSIKSGSYQLKENDTLSIHWKI